MRKIKLPFEREPVETAGHVDYFPCYLAGEPWRYALVDEAQMKILAEEVTAETPPGLMSSGASAIYFLKGSVTHTTAIHELMHAYFAQTLTHSASLTADQVEEIMCDIAAFNWFRVVLLARVMVHNMLCYEDYLKGNKVQDWEDCPADVIDGKVPEHIIDLMATYIHSCGLNPLLKAAIGKKKRKARF